MAGQLDRRCLDPATGTGGRCGVVRLRLGGRQRSWCTRGGAGHSRSCCRSTKPKTSHSRR